MPAEVSHPTKLLIGGAPVDGEGATAPIENPFTTDSIVDMRFASAEQVDAAVAATREAWPGWARIERKEWWYPYAQRSS